MTIEKTITLHTFDELSDEAKERAREWWRRASEGDEWWEHVYEDAATIAGLMGIELDQKPVKLMGGGTRYDPKIWFSGFWSQGDGACFEGRYRYAKGSVKAVTGHAPQDEKLAQIVRGLFDVQARNFYRLEAKVTHTGSYCHAHSTEIEVFNDRAGYYAPEDAAKEVAELLRDFMNWIYRQLEAEWQYQNADEQVDDNIRANEYTFRADGRREDA